MKRIIRMINYVKGIKIKIKPTFSNDGPSTHTWIVASCHPKDSLTWHWAIYCSAPRLSIKWILNPGFWFRKQKLMYKV